MKHKKWINMIRNKNHRLFGPPQSSLSYLSGPVYQRGSGIGSFFKGIFHKVLPFAKNAIKQIASSNIVKDTAKQLTKHGTEGALNIAADLIEGKDPSIKAREKLQDAKNDIAKVLPNES